jgi:hypothetical protein
MRRLVLCLLVLTSCARTPAGRRAVFIGAGTVLAGSAALIATGLVKQGRADCSNTCFETATNMWTGGIALALLSGTVLGAQAATKLHAPRPPINPLLFLLPLALPLPAQQPPPPRPIGEQ